MTAPRAEIFERLAGQSEEFLSGWAEREKKGLVTFRRIWRLKELAYRPIEEFPDLAERFRLFEEWLGNEGMELAATLLTQFQMEEISAALEKLKLFLPRNGGGAEAGTSSNQLTELSEKFVARLTGKEVERPTFTSGPELPSSPSPSATLKVFDDRSSSGETSLDSASPASFGTSRDKSLETNRDKPSAGGGSIPLTTGDLSEDFQKLLTYELEYMREYRKPGEHPFSVIGRLLDALSARYHLADEVFVAHLLYFLQAQKYPVGPYLERFRQVKSRVKK